MKKTLLMMCGVACLNMGANAAELYFTGGTEQWWEEKTNWAVKGEDNQLTTATAKPYYGDTMYIGSADNSYHVKIGENQKDSPSDYEYNTFYDMTINIAAGSTLTVTKHDAKFWGSTITVGTEKGLVFTKPAWGNIIKETGVGSSALTLNLGLVGSVQYQDEFKSVVADNIIISGVLDMGCGDTYIIKSRTLLDFASTQVTDLSGYERISTTFSGAELSTGNVPLAATAENAGKYWLVYDATNKDLNVCYVAAIPEPATATLSLLALAGLAARRRRK